MTKFGTSSSSVFKLNVQSQIINCNFTIISCNNQNVIIKTNTSINWTYFWMNGYRVISRVTDILSMQMHFYWIVGEISIEQIISFNVLMAHWCVQSYEHQLGVEQSATVLIVWQEKCNAKIKKRKFIVRYVNPMSKLDKVTNRKLCWQCYYVIV